MTLFVKLVCGTFYELLMTHNRTRLKCIWSFAAVSLAKFLRQVILGHLPMAQMACAWMQSLQETRPAQSLSLWLDFPSNFNQPSW